MAYGTSLVVLFGDAGQTPSARLETLMPSAEHRRTLSKSVNSDSLPACSVQNGMRLPCLVTLVWAWRTGPLLTVSSMAITETKPQASVEGYIHRRVVPDWHRANPFFRLSFFSSVSLLVAR